MKKFVNKRSVRQLSIHEGRIAALWALIALLGVAAGCESNIMEGEVGGTNPLQIAPACYSERWEQPDRVAHSKVDLLFVTDTSSSLFEERRHVATRIDSLVSQLPPEVDLRIAVMLAHGSRANFSGFLWHREGVGPVLDTTTQSISSIRSDLYYLLTHTDEDLHSDGGEEGLYSFWRSFQPGHLQSTQAHGLYREDAALAVVFISDENDICARYPEGVRPVPDREGREDDAFARDCEGITPESVLARIRHHQQDRPFLVAGITYNDSSTYPRTGENELGYGYLELVQLAGGVSIDMASADYHPGLAAIGGLIADEIELYGRFKLTQAPADAESIQVEVDGVPTEFAFEAADQIVVPSDPGQAGSEVVINYCLQAEPEPEPTESPSPEPTESPSPEPTESPSPEPTESPSPEPTESPSPEPTESPSPEPTESPSPEPTESPSPEPTESPSPEPTESPSPEPTESPCTGFGCDGGVIGV